MDSFPSTLFHFHTPKFQTSNKTKPQRITLSLSLPPLALCLLVKNPILFFSSKQSRMMKQTTNVNVTVSFTIVLVLTVMFVGFGSCNLDQDRAECADQLMALSPCLSYVSGEAKSPSLDCCTALRPVLDKSKKCICLLIKDRNDPNLGIKINGTLALSLPTACHASSTYNVTQCIDLLHLPPNSADAKELKELGLSGNSTKATPVPKGTSNSTNTSSSAPVKSDSGMGKTKMSTNIFCGILLLSFSSHLIFHVPSK